MKKLLASLLSILLLISCLQDKNTPIAENPIIPTPVNPIPTTLVCDTLNINFDKSIMPILQANCIACHSAKQSSGGVDLSTYEKIVPYITNGKLYGSIMHLAGYKPMPTVSSQLSKCDLATIRKWLVDSYPAGSTAVNLNPKTPYNPILTSTGTPTNPIGNIICNPDTVYFKQTILPLILSNCAMSGCHDAISKREGVQLTDYSTIMKTVRAGDPTNSSLYRSMIRTDDERMPPPPAKAFDAATLALISKWIKQGAKNNSCDASAINCVTTNISYAAIVVPILKQNCTGCHSGTAPSGAIDLSTYTNVTKYISNGKLYGSIVHSPGFIPMPSATSSLSTCEISQIKSWIDAGSKNN
jgi:hypothetical protein